MTNLTPEQKRQRNVTNQRNWRKNNPEKVKAQKRRYHKRTYIKKLRNKPYTSEKEHARLRKRLDAALITDSYLRENVARRLDMAVSDIPDELLELCRPLLQLKRCLRKKKMKDRWISVEDRLPLHDDFILVYTEKGQAVCIFVDSKIINSELEKNGVTETVDIEKDPYFFCSRESLERVVQGVTHWMPLPESPCD